MGRNLFSAVGAIAWTLLLPACVCPPEAADVLAVGFRTPEQAFRTFQTATRLDDPDLELRCFSLGFRARNHISQLTWREARAELYARQPWLRAGIAGAEIVEAQPDRGAVRLRIDTAGGEYVVVLVREDFAEAWAGGERVLDEELVWRTQTGVQKGEGEGRWVFGRTQLSPAIDASALTELRFGREWKIDDVGELTASDQATSEKVQPHRAQAPRSIAED